MLTIVLDEDKSPKLLTGEIYEVGSEEKGKWTVESTHRTRIEAEKRAKQLNREE